MAKPKALGMGGLQTPRSRHLLKKYGITEDQYNELLQNQEEACAVCKRPARDFKTRLCVDHDHFTGHIRGLLCTYCNRRVVGRYRQGNHALLLAAYDYINREYKGWVVPPKKKKRRKKKRK